MFHRPDWGYLPETTLTVVRPATTQRGVDRCGVAARRHGRRLNAANDAPLPPSAVKRNPACTPVRRLEG